MEFDFTEEQKILKKSAHDFLAREFPREVVSELEESDLGYSPELWRKMAELGWMGLILPEEYGGSGGSYLDLTVLLEEMGYNTCPGPFFASVVLGALPILEAGTEAQKQAYLPKLAAGERILTLAFNEPGAGLDASSVQATISVDQDAVRTSGTKLFVLDAHVADTILWVARNQESVDPEKGISILLVDAESPGITCTPLKTLARDKQFEVVFDDVGTPRNRELRGTEGGWAVVRDTLEKASLARGAEMLGGAQAVMDMALTYAQDRVQFDRPIGSFQAIQHHFADMWIDINGSRILLYGAAWRISQGLPAHKEVAMAKARIGEAYRRVTILGHQIFGGIGFTMEHPMHLYHRRSIAGEVAFGDSDFQKEKVAQELGL
jgi:alkylation response protein AidB-like acyl-CoA dehydrogenase